MYTASYFFDSVRGEDLDRLLSVGYFRMGKTVFTTNFLKLEDKINPTIWLRIDLEKEIEADGRTKLYKQNKRFEATIQPFCWSKAKEDLYEKYRNSLSFSTSATLAELLEFEMKVFDSYEVSVFDGPKLIAVGVFDLGLKTAAGITSFFDPEYRKFSLGRYLMHLKMDFCQKQGLKFFYPGYVSPGNVRFDYKLNLAPTQTSYFSFKTGRWRISKGWNMAKKNLLTEMTKNLSVLSQLLDKKGVTNKLWLYDFFDAELYDTFKNQHLLGFPLMLSCQKIEPETKSFVGVVFDPRTKSFHVVRFVAAYITSNQPQYEGHYYANILQLNFHFGVFSTAEQALDRIEKMT